MRYIINFDAFTSGNFDPNFEFGLLIKLFLMEIFFTFTFLFKQKMYKYV